MLKNAQLFFAERGGASWGARTVRPKVSVKSKFFFFSSV